MVKGKRTTPESAAAATEAVEDAGPSSKRSRAATSRKGEAAASASAAGAHESKAAPAAAVAAPNGKEEASQAGLRYLRGFGGHFESEALPKALPMDKTTPQHCPYGLFAEQLSGTSFTTGRAGNQRSWLYRIRPSAAQSEMTPIKGHGFVGDFSKAHVNPNRMRWRPFPLPPDSKRVDFVAGTHTLGGAGSTEAKSGFAIHIYACNASMENKAMVNADGDLLFVPQQGTILLRTEFGCLEVPPGFVAVVQRGIKFSVDVSGPTRGYICEVFNGHFRLPDLGPIGSNGLAQPRDFEHPTAAFEDRAGPFTLVYKFLGELYEAQLKGSPFDVVAWQGNYVPYRYDLDKFVVINSVSVDHLDPSIFTVLTCPTTEPGVACCDFVIFPPRWMVQLDTFRPPYFHRNCMTEFMGNIKGEYDAKPTGFAPGSGSLHSCMVPHGPDREAVDKALKADTHKPFYMEGALAFMFESTYVMRLTDWGLRVSRDEAYDQVWAGLDSMFRPTP